MNEHIDHIEKWFSICDEWLTGLGYTIIYSNHPSLEKREFHWIKDQIRVCCVFNKNYIPHCYLSVDLLLPMFPLTLKTGRYSIKFEHLQKVHEKLQQCKKVLMYGPDRNKEQP